MDKATTATIKLIQSDINQILALQITEPAVLIGALVKIDTLLKRLPTDGDRHREQKKVSSGVRSKRSSSGS